MRWDEVEAEMLIISAQLTYLSRSFGRLAVSLQREREAGTLARTRGDDPGYDKDQTGLQLEAFYLPEDEFDEIYASSHD